MICFKYKLYGELGFSLLIWTGTKLGYDHIS